MISIVVAEGLKDGVVVREKFYHGGDWAVRDWAKNNNICLTKTYRLNGLDPLDMQEAKAQLLMQGITLKNGVFGDEG